jgi:hypothetical protein
MPDDLDRIPYLGDEQLIISIDVGNFACTLLLPLCPHLSPDPFVGPQHPSPSSICSMDDLPTRSAT